MKSMRGERKTTQIVIRMPKEWLVQVDSIRKIISRPGFEATRSDAYRIAMAEGFKALKADARPPRGGK